MWKEILTARERFSLSGLAGQVNSASMRIRECLTLAALSLHGGDLYEFVCEYPIAATNYTFL